MYRYDDRGTGKSEGKFKYNAYHNIADLRCAFNAIKNNVAFSKKTIGILGHSVGAYAATILHFEKELDIKFLILIGSPVSWKGKWIKEHKVKGSRKKVSCKTIYRNITIPTLFIGGINDTRSNIQYANSFKAFKGIR